MCEAVDLSAQTLKDISMMQREMRRAWKAPSWSLMWFRARRKYPQSAERQPGDTRVRIYFTAPSMQNSKIDICTAAEVTHHI